MTTRFTQPEWLPIILATVVVIGIAVTRGCIEEGYQDSTGYHQGKEPANDNE